MEEGSSIKGSKGTGLRVPLGLLWYEEGIGWSLCPAQGCLLGDFPDGHLKELVGSS